MIFEQQQIEKLLEIIDLHSSLFITSQMGEDVLSSFDKYILNKFGFDVKNIVQKYPPYFQNFIFGRLTSWLSDNQASRIVYSDFKKHLETGQYFPLTNQEQNLYSIAKKRSYSHIKNLGSKMKETLTTNISEEDVRRELSESISKRKSIQSIISEWGNKTGNWQRDYGRIAETEMNSIFNLGRATQFKERHGEDSKAYKTVYSGACRHCQRLYTTAGVGSKPRIFTLEQLILNGSNIGRKVADWKAVIDSTHPFCRCMLKTIPPGTEWDEDKKMFLYPEKYERKIERKSKVIITVGDKKFEA
jgi:hypothetical protein